MKEFNYIFTENRYNQMLIALRNLNLTHIIKIKETKPPIKQANCFQITLSLDEKNSKELFFLGIEFNNVGNQRADKIKEVKQIWKCDKCKTDKKGYKYLYVLNYCDKCYAEIHSNKRMELEQIAIENKKRIKEREPPINILADEIKRINEVPLPIITFKLSKK